LGPGSLAMLTDAARTPEQEAADREIQVALDRAITSLDPSQREILLLRDVEGLTAPEVAAVTHLSVEAVKSRLHRARLALREKLAPALGAPETPSPMAEPCPDVLAILSSYVEEELEPAACGQMEKHLDACPACRTACASLKQMLALCRNFPVPPVPASVGESVQHAIRLFLAQHPG
jgi:RNA polymerase sigma-70 factor (ECF subfamily)